MCNGALCKAGTPRSGLLVGDMGCSYAGYTKQPTSPVMGPRAGLYYRELDFLIRARTEVS